MNRHEPNFAGSVVRDRPAEPSLRSVRMLKAERLLTALVSAIGSSFLLYLFLGTGIAVGLIALYFVHEIGHILVLRHYGIPVRSLVFRPWGARTDFDEKLVPNQRADLAISLAGPVFGILFASMLLTVSVLMSSVDMIVLSATLLFVAPFDLLPIPSADGGVFLRLYSRYRMKDSG